MMMAAAAMVIAVSFENGKERKIKKEKEKG
jgi:hypothetical protein